MTGSPTPTRPTSSCTPTVTPSASPRVRGRQEKGRHDPDRLVRRVQSHLPSGRLRDQLIARHITRDVLPDLAEPFLEADDTARDAIVQSVAHRCAAWVTPGVRAQLDATDQVRLAVVAGPSSGWSGWRASPRRRSTGRCGTSPGRATGSASSSPPRSKGFPRRRSGWSCETAIRRTSGTSTSPPNATGSSGRRGSKGQGHRASGAVHRRAGGAALPHPDGHAQPAERTSSHPHLPLMRMTRNCSIVVENSYKSGGTACTSRMASSPRRSPIGARRRGGGRCGRLPQAGQVRTRRPHRAHGGAGRGLHLRRADAQLPHRGRAPPGTCSAGRWRRYSSGPTRPCCASPWCWPCRGSSSPTAG